MKITREEVLYVAELAHLELTESEVEMYRSQLDEILTYIDKLKELDVTRVEPMAQVLFEVQEDTAGLKPIPTAKENPALREDVFEPCEVATAVLEGAPDANKPYFRVPKVIDR